MKRGDLGLKGTDSSDGGLFLLWGFPLFTHRSQVCLGKSCTSARAAVVRRKPGLCLSGGGCTSGEREVLYSCAKIISTPALRVPFCVLTCLVYCVTFRSKDHSSHYSIQHFMVSARSRRFIYSNNNEVFSSFLLNSREEVTYGRTLKGIPRKEGDVLLELSSFSLATGTSVNSAEGKEAV